MPATPNTPRPRTRTRTPSPDAPPPLRRAQIPPSPYRPKWRRALNFFVVFALAVLLADALVGDRGLVATMRAREQKAELVESLERLRHENRALRESGRRLREDRSAIEELARRELGLIRPGEVLVVVKDVKPSSH